MNRYAKVLYAVAALGLPLVVQSARASVVANPGEPNKAGMKSEVASRDLEKYDLNKDGKLDEDETAAMKTAKEKAKEERAAKRKAKILAQYDVNRNGQLDPEEEAAWKADQEKAKAERKAKRLQKSQGKPAEPGPEKGPDENPETDGS